MFTIRSIELNVAQIKSDRAERILRLQVFSFI